MDLPFDRHSTLFISLSVFFEADFLDQLMVPDSHLPSF